MPDEQQTVTDLPITLPNGNSLDGHDPVIIVGPNGAGKTRLSRNISTMGANREYVNALRNTRISPELPVMSKVQALTNHQSQRGQAESQPWEIVTDFDFVLAQLLTDDSDAARKFRDDVKAGRTAESINTSTALESVQSIWAQIFEGRSLTWDGWSPIVLNESTEPPQYTANHMSDGERAALYLASKVMLTPENTVLFVDEPETHFHSLLAIRLWDELERRRRDLRFIYITHDLTFAMSRSKATFLVAGPESGLTVASIAQDLPLSVRTEILGAASFSYYARRTIFCEGEPQSYDARFFNAWFSGRDTAVFPVGSCEMVRQCVDVLNQASFVANSNALGLIDRDFFPDTYFAGLDRGLTALPFHEIEGLVCLPTIYELVRLHLGRAPIDIESEITTSISEEIIVKTAHERWKLRIRNTLESYVSTKPDGFDATTVKSHVSTIEAALPTEIDLARIFDEELSHVRDVVASNDPLRILRTFPSKSIVGRLARKIGQTPEGLFTLTINALNTTDEKDALYGLGNRLEAALTAAGLPGRRAE